MKKIILIFIFLATFFSCKKENNCFINGGDIVNKTFNSNPFSGVEINDFMNFNWKKSPEFKVEIEGRENFVSGISNTITEYTLIFNNDNGCKLLRRNVDEITITVFCPSLNTLTLKGSGRIIFIDTLKNDLTINCIANQGSMNLLIDNNYTKFYLESGSTDINIKGSTRYCDYYSSGVNHFYAKTFDTDSFRCHSRSKGITEIKANSWLHIEQNGDSDINYWGNPSTIDVASYLGNGSIINRN